MTSFLDGNFAPVRTERTELELDVTGTLPEALAGRYLRNGPDPVEDPPESHHWFLGDGMVHGIEIRDRRAVSYRNRWVRTPHVAEVLGESAPPRLDQGLGSGAVNVVGHAGRILALGEVGYAFELSPELDTIGQLDLGGRFAGNFTAHPKVDPVTGEMLGFGYDMAPPYLRYFRISADGELVQLEPVELSHCSMMHDFAVTESRVVFMELPVVLDLDRFGAGKFPFSWNDEAPARLGVMPRAGDNDGVAWVEVEPCYVFHVLNAYDRDDGAIVADVIRYDRMFHTDHRGPDGYGSLWRWEIDPGAGRVIERQLDDASVEFPRVDPRRELRPHRYGYGAEIVPDGGFEGGGLVRWDLQTGERQVHEVGRGRHAGEAVFVPDPDGVGEDDGWLLSLVYDSSTDRSDLIVVDGRAFAGPPVATVHLPVRVPYGFHGNWVPDTALA